MRPDDIRREPPAVFVRAAYEIVLGREPDPTGLADWTSELSQFFTFYTQYRQVNADPGLPELRVPVGSIKGSRTPCLEGRPGQLMPARSGFCRSSIFEIRMESSRFT